MSCKFVICDFLDLVGAWVVQEDYTDKCTTLLRAVIDSILVGMKADGSFDALWKAALSKYQTQSCKATKSNITKGLKFAEMYGIFVAYAVFVGAMFVYGLLKLWVLGEAAWPEVMDLYLYQEVLYYIDQHPEEFDPVAKKMNSVVGAYYADVGRLKKFSFKHVEKASLVTITAKSCKDRWIYLMKKRKPEYFADGAFEATACEEWPPILDTRLLSFFRNESFPFEDIAKAVQEMAVYEVQLIKDDYSAASIVKKHSFEINAHDMEMLAAEVSVAASSGGFVIDPKLYTKQACFKRFYEMYDGLKAGESQKETLKHMIKFRISEMKYAAVKEIAEEGQLVYEEIVHDIEQLHLPHPHLQLGDMSRDAKDDEDSVTVVETPKRLSLFSRGIGIDNLGNAPAGESPKNLDVPPGGRDDDHFASRSRKGR